MKTKCLVAALLLFVNLGTFAQVTDSITRLVKMEGGLNFRDVGGYPTNDGKTVIKGKVFRSADISKLTDNDMKKMADNYIYTVIDFRGTKEAATAPDRQFTNTDYTLCPAGSDNLPDAKQMVEMLKQEDFLLTMYGKPSIQYYGERYRPMFVKLLTLPEGNAGLLYHCTGGRDRTGMATALFLYLLDVPMNVIEADFVASNIYLKPMNKDMYVGMAQMMGTTVDEIEKKMMLRPELLQNFFASITETYGSMDNFYLRELGIGKAEKALLKTKYTK